MHLEVTNLSMGGESQVIGSCGVIVNVEAGTFDVDWFDGSIPGGGGMGL